MKLVIRKVPERNTEKLESVLPNALIVNDIKHNGCLWSFSQALIAAKDDAIYIQDDMILCKNFVSKATEIIKRVGDYVIVFSYPCKPRDREREDLYNGFRTPFCGGGLLCTYIPNRVRVAFLKDKQDGSWRVSEYVAKNQLDDVDFGKWLRSKGEVIYYTVPNLAGHAYGESVINKNKPKNRLCADFDYNDVEMPWREL